MKPESHGAVVIEPNTIIEIGSVARQAIGVMVCPASPPITKIMVIWLPRIACAATSTATLRRARASDGVPVGAKSALLIHRPYTPRPG